MTALLAFTFTLILLFFSSQLLTKALSKLLYRFTRNQKTVITILALFFLPGVIIHELSHFLMANILFVKTGEIEFLPKIQGDTVKLGSVGVGPSDPFRRALIGLAPMFVGVPLLLVALSYIVSLHFVWNREMIIQYLLAGYGMFEIGNTLFSSKKDLEGTVELGGALGIIAVILYGSGVHQPFLYLVSLITPHIAVFLAESAKLLFIPIAVNVSIYLFSRLLEKR